MKLEKSNKTYFVQDYFPEAPKKEDGRKATYRLITDIYMEGFPNSRLRYFPALIRQLPHGFFFRLRALKKTVWKNQTKIKRLC